MTTPAAPSPTRWASRRWPLIVLALLGGHVALMTTAVTLAVRGHNEAGITPDYYQKALDWDQTQAAARRSAALGWAVTLTPEIWLDADGGRAVVVLAEDAAGEPITGADVSATAFHRLTPDDTSTAAATETEPGRYALRLPMARPGEWRVAVRIERGTDLYERAFIQAIAALPAAPAAEGGRP